MVHGERIITLVAKYRIACCLGRHATAGGLILYGPDLSEVSNRLREFASQVCLLGCCGYNAQALDSPEPLPLAQTRPLSHRGGHLFIELKRTYPGQCSLVAA
jgi:hypothetical protein